MAGSSPIRASTGTYFPGDEDFIAGVQEGRWPNLRRRGGLLGTDDVFAADLQALRPQPGQALSAANMRAVLADSPIRDSHRDPAACTRVQDAYSLRCAPQVAGGSRDTARGSAFPISTRAKPTAPNATRCAPGSPPGG